MRTKHVTNTIMETETVRGGMLFSHWFDPGYMWPWWVKDFHYMADHRGQALSQRFLGRWRQGRGKEILRNRCRFMGWEEGKSYSVHVHVATGWSLFSPSCSYCCDSKTYLLEHLDFLEAGCIKIGVLLEAYYYSEDWVPQGQFYWHLSSRSTKKYLLGWVLAETRCCFKWKNNC